MADTEKKEPIRRIDYIDNIIREHRAENAPKPETGGTTQGGTTDSEP